MQRNLDFENQRIVGYSSFWKLLQKQVETAVSSAGATMFLLYRTATLIYFLKDIKVINKEPNALLILELAAIFNLYNLFQTNNFEQKNHEQLRQIARRSPHYLFSSPEKLRESFSHTAFTASILFSSLFAFADEILSKMNFYDGLSDAYFEMVVLLIILSGFSLLEATMNNFGAQRAGYRV